MDAMPRPRPPYLQRQITRHGVTCWYVRKGKGARTRLRAEFGSGAFWEEYRAALTGEPVKRATASVGSLQWLWARYRETGAWTGLAVATRKQRENIMLHVLEASGNAKASKIAKKHIVAGRDRRAPTPSQARNFIDAMRGLFRWAADAGHVASDPTQGVAYPARPDTGGFPIWSEDEIDRYQDRWPIGTKERVWLDVLLYTGLRRGDAVKLGRQHVRDGMAKIRTEKTKVEVTIPILAVLAATLAAGPCAELAFICGESGKPLTKESFGNLFRIACRKAGIRKSAHGLRKAGCTRAANNGATRHEMDAIFGWQGGTMAALYTEQADRARLAKRAMSKLEREPSPDKKVRA